MVISRRDIAYDEGGVVRVEINENNLMAYRGKHKS
jgi:hypothetical protein